MMWNSSITAESSFKLLCKSPNLLKAATTLISSSMHKVSQRDHIAVHFCVWVILLSFMF